MDEKNIKINSVKLSQGKNDKIFYYQKNYFENLWRKISKETYENVLKENLSTSTNVERDSDENIIFLEYPHENSKQHRERIQREIDLNIREKQPLPNKDNYISLIKKTLGKDGKYYFYDSSGYLDKLNEISWTRIDEKFYNFILTNYKNNALNIQKDEDGNVVYMEYKNSTTLTKSTDSQKENKKGCVILFAFAIITCIVYPLL